MALSAPINLNHPGHYLNWGFIQISVANLTVIGVMVLIFLAAILLPFPQGRPVAKEEPTQPDEEGR